MAGQPGLTQYTIGLGVRSFKGAMQLVLVVSLTLQGACVVGSTAR